MSDNGKDIDLSTEDTPEKLSEKILPLSASQKPPIFYDGVDIGRFVCCFFVRNV